MSDNRKERRRVAAQEKNAAYRSARRATRLFNVRNALRRVLRRFSRRGV